jgi:hypothetical protein
MSQQPNTYLLSERFGKSVGLGILSWKSEQTLTNTLESHAAAGLFELFDQVLIHFQEIRPQDEELARRFGLDYVGSEKNRHIGGGFYKLIKSLETEYIFLLEDDLTLDDDRDALYRTLSDAIHLIERDEIDILRCRRRGNTQKVYSKYRKIHEFDESVNDVDESYFPKVSAPKRLLNRIRNPFRAHRTIAKAPWIEKHPETVFPKQIRRVPALHNDVYVLQGTATKWSNPAIFAHRRFFREVYDYINSQTPGFEEFGLSLEKLVNKRNRDWWLKQGYRMGVTKPILINHERAADGGKSNPNYPRYK